VFVVAVLRGVIIRRGSRGRKVYYSDTLVSILVKSNEKKALNGCQSSIRIWKKLTVTAWSSEVRSQSAVD
jgi:hypothetical protein